MLTDWGGADLGDAHEPDSTPNNTATHELEFAHLAKSAAPVVFLSPVENPLPGQNGRDASEMVDGECIVKTVAMRQNFTKGATVAVC